LHTPDSMAMRNRTSALTDNFLPLEIEGPLAANQLVTVRIDGLDPDGALHAIGAACLAC
jgi:hypothetical protein